MSDLQPIAAAASPVLSRGSRDSAEQVLDPRGHLVASSPEESGQPLLTPSALSDALRGQPRLDGDP